MKNLVVRTVRLLMGIALALILGAGGVMRWGPQLHGVGETTRPAQTRGGQPVSDAAVAEDGMPAAPEATAEPFAIYLVADNAPAAWADMVSELPALTLEPTPILSASDIVTYDAATHEMQLTAAAFERIGALDVPVAGRRFVVCVGEERIYPGAFWASYSSLSFDGLVIDPLPAMAGREDCVLSMALGYPSPDFFTGEDPRSDPRVLASLDAAERLK